MGGCLFWDKGEDMIDLIIKICVVGLIVACMAVFFIGWGIVINEWWENRKK